MKLTKVALGCALVTGLMAFAPVQSHAAGGVISNQLYKVVNIKATYTYTTTTNGPIKKATLSSKQVLADIGYSGNVVLALGPGNTKFLVVNTKTGAILQDLSVSNILTLSQSPIVVTSQSQGGTNGAVKGSAAGYGSLTFYSQGSSGTQSAVWFFLAGNYSGTASASKVANGSRNVSEQVKSTASYGYGNVVSLGAMAVSPTQKMTCTGTFTASGSGKITVP